MGGGGRGSVMSGWETFSLEGLETNELCMLGGGKAGLSMMGGFANELDADQLFMPLISLSEQEVADRQ